MLVFKPTTFQQYRFWYQHCKPIAIKTIQIQERRCCSKQRLNILLMGWCDIVYHQLANYVIVTMGAPLTYICAKNIAVSSLCSNVVKVIFLLIELQPHA